MLALAAAAAATCGGETAVETIVGPDAVRCETTLGGPSTPVPPAGGTVNVAITAARDCTWTAASDVSWMQLNATSGQGAATLGVTVAQNDAGTPRSGAVVVNNQRFTIAQQPRPCTYELRASPQHLNAGGGRGSVSITTPAGCAWTATSSAGWLRVLTTAGSGPGAADFEASANDGGARDASISIGGQSISISQSGAGQSGGGDNCSVSLTPASVNAPAGGATQNVAVITNCDWRATSNAPWLRVSPGSGNGNGSIAVTSDRNTGGSRTGTVTVGEATLTVNQAAAPVCTATINDASANFPAAGGEGRVRVTTPDNCDWTASGGTEWARITTPRGTGSDDVRYTVARNDGTSQRSTTLTIAGHNHVVTQEGAAAPSCTYTLQPTSQDHPFGGGSGGFTVATQAGCNWSVSTGGANWITNVTQAGNSVSYVVQPNSGGARQASMTVSGGGGSASHNVTQQAMPAQTCSFTITPGSQDFPAAGGNQSFTVSTQQGCTWTASSNQGWARVTSSSGSSPVAYTVDANTGGARQATITVSGGGGSATHSITQQAQPAQTCSYTLQPGSQDFPSAGGSGSFTVSTQAGCTWSASSNQGWARITSSSGSSPVTYTVESNNGGSRQATISVSGGGGSASHSVTQQATAPTCTYQVQPGSQQFTAAGGNGSFTVVTQQGCAWTLSGGASWITAVTQNGNAVSYTVQANGTGAQRQTNFTVSFTGGSQSHSVTQLP